MFREPGSGRAVLARWLLAVVGLVAITLSEAASVDVSVRRLLASTAGTRLCRVGLLLLANGVAAVVAVRRRSGGTAVVLGSS